MFDNLKSFGTPNYYVQKLYGNNAGTDLINMHEDGKPLIGQDGIFGSAVWDEVNNTIILKVVNRNSSVKNVNFDIKTQKEISGEVQVIELSSDDLNIINTIDNPENITPVDKTIDIKGKEFEAKLNPYSFTIFKIKS